MTLYQKGASIGGLSDGGFVITWEQEGGSDYDIYAQRYDSLNRLQGSKFRVNSYTNGNQSSSVVVGLGAGGFVVSWASGEEYGSHSDVYARCFSSLEEPLGMDFRVNTFSAAYQCSPSVALQSDGGFVVTWESNGPDGVGYIVMARRYDAHCTAIGGDFAVSDASRGAQRFPSVAGLDDGSYVIAWTEYSDSADYGSCVNAQRFDAFDVHLGETYLVSEGHRFNQKMPAIAQIDGGVVISWEGHTSVNSYYKEVVAKRYVTSEHWSSTASSTKSEDIRSKYFYFFLGIIFVVGIVVLLLCLYFLCWRKKKENSSVRNENLVFN